MSTEMKAALVGGVIGAAATFLLALVTGMFVLGESKGTVSGEISTIKAQLSEAKSELSELRKERAEIKQQLLDQLKIAQESLKKAADEHVATLRAIELPKAVVLEPSWYGAGEVFRVLSDQVLVEVKQVTSFIKNAEFLITVPGKEKVQVERATKGDRRTFEFRGKTFSLDVLEFRKKEDASTSTEQVRVSIVRIL